MRSVRHTDAVLIVDVRDFRNVQGLSSVKVLLVFQYPLVEELLELLVAVVYAELLEAVDLEVLCKHERSIVSLPLLPRQERVPESARAEERNLLTESGDIQHAYVIARSLEGYTFIDSRDYVVEQLAVNGLGERVPSIISLVNLQGHPAAVMQTVKCKLKNRGNIKFATERSDILSFSTDDSNVLHEIDLCKNIQKLFAINARLYE